MITAAQLNEIKSKINTEISRRTNSQSRTDVTLTNPAFSETPAAGKVIKAEHGNKTIGVLAQFSAIGSVARGGGKSYVADMVIPSDFDYTILKNFIDNLAAKSVTAGSGQANTGCAGSCTGLCAGSCYSSCIGNFTDIFSGNFFNAFNNFSNCSNFGVNQFLDNGAGYSNFTNSSFTGNEGFKGFYSNYDPTRG